jgi:dynein heavy chain
LYANVVSTIKGYGDYFWVDVVEKIDEWGEQVQQFKNQCSKLPKALRDWQAFRDCRDTIDNFVDMLPLFQALASKAMRDRHWNQVSQITGARPMAVKATTSDARRPLQELAADAP